MRARFFAALAVLVALPAFASITGTVMTRDGQPLAGVKVSVYSFEPADARRARLVSANPERAPLASTTTSSKGAFTLDSPKDPVVTIRIDAAGYAPHTTDIERDEDSLVFALSSAPVKQGTITASGKPVANAHVVWLGQEGEVLATTDDKGHYSAPDPTKWAGRVVVSHPDYALFDETRGAKMLPLDFSLDAGVPVTGKVVASDGSPAAKTSIIIDTWPVATSGDDGSFTVAHASKKWDSLEAHAGDRIAMRTREGKSAASLKLTAAASVAGVVRDAHQQPIVGATVSLPSNVPGRPGRGAVASTVTDAKGNYSITGVKPGRYQVVVSHPGYFAAPVNVSLTAGAKLQKPLVALPRARISGTVVDDDKRAVAAASIQADTVSRDPMGLPRNVRRMMAGLPNVRTAFSGPDGRFSVRTDTQGDIELEASKKGVPTAKTSAIHITAGEKKSGVTIVMPRGVAISGIVIDKQGKPLSGAAVTASENEGGPMPGGIRRMIVSAIRGGADDDDTVRTGTDGKFTTRVKEGTYDVIAKREGFSTKTVRAVTANATTKPLEITMEPGVEISGRVTRAGNPVEGINVAVMASDNSELGVTGPDGRFSISDLTPGPYMVVFNKQDEFVQQMRNISAPANNVNIDLPPGGRISGRVLDKNTHQPVTSFNAGVSTARMGGGIQIDTPPMMKSFTSDDGSFSLDNVPTGTVAVVASAPGYTTARQTNVTIEAGKSVDNLELDLDTGVKLSGHVTGPDGSPLAGVAVRPASGGGGAMRIVANFGGADATAATTDGNGDYTIDQLEAGTKSFSFTMEGYLPTTKSVDLSGHEARLDAQLSSGLHVTGVVVTDSGAPVPDADVRASSAVSGSGGFRATKTDASGSFMFDSIAPGHYAFTASKAGYADGNITDFDVSSNAPVRIALKTGGVIYGHVTGLGPDDLQHVTVTARNNNGNGEAAVDGSGNYRIVGAPTGTVRVSADLMRSLGNAQTTDPQTIDVEPGASVEVDLAFNTNTIVRGQVTRDGVPLAGASVNFIPAERAGAQVAVSTDDGGNYTAAGLTNGSSYSVMVLDTQRMNPFSTHYDVNGSSTFNIDIKSTPLTGHVTDAGSGDPVANARIQVKSKETGVGGMIATRGASTDGNGNFTIDSVSPGTYTVTADKDGYGNDVRDVSVTDSGAPPVQLTIAKADGVTLTVVDARDNQPLNPAVNVFDAAGRNVYSSIFRGLSAGSSSTPLPLSPGQYTASVAAMGYAPRTVRFTSPSSQTVQLTPGGTIVVTAKNTDNTRRARLIDASGAVYARPFSPDATYPIPGTNNTIQNIAPGTYQLQVLVNGAVVNTVTVTVAEGVTVPAAI